MGKNKVARVAFGKTPSEEAKDGLSDAGKKLVGNKGLLFTNSSSRDVLKYVLYCLFPCRYSISSTCNLVFMPL